MDYKFMFQNLEKIKKLALLDLKEEKISLVDELNFNIITDMKGIAQTADFNKKYRELHDYILVVCRHVREIKKIAETACKKIIVNPDLYDVIMTQNNPSILFDLIEELRDAL